MYVHVIPHMQVQLTLQLEPPSLANHIPSARLGSVNSKRNSPSIACSQAIIIYLMALLLGAGLPGHCTGGVSETPLEE